MTAREVLAAARARADAATDGPWSKHDFGHTGEQEPNSIVVHTGKFDWNDLNDQNSTSAVAWMPAWDSQEDSNAEFIAAARTDVPALVDALTAVLDLIDQRRRLIALHPEDLNGVGGVAVEAFCDDIAATIEHHLREED